VKGVCDTRVIGGGMGVGRCSGGNLNFVRRYICLFTLK
jgi:hypothetical protein